jgi:hypothetical protein
MAHISASLAFLGRARSDMPNHLGTALWSWVLARWQGRVAAARWSRRWRASGWCLTDAGLVVLMITVLVANQASRLKPDSTIRRWRLTAAFHFPMTQAVAVVRIGLIRGSSQRQRRVTSEGPEAVC